MSDAPKKSTSVQSTLFLSKAGLRLSARGAEARVGAVSDVRLTAPITERPVLAGVLGAFVIAFSAILVRLADVSPSSAAFFRCAYALPVLGLLAWLARRRYGPRARRERLIALGAGVWLAADLVFWHHSIAAVGAGLATVLGNIQVILVGLIAWAALGERPDNRSLAAIPMVFAGVVLISGVIGAGAYGDEPALGVVYGV